MRETSSHPNRYSLFWRATALMIVAVLCGYAVAVSADQFPKEKPAKRLDVNTAGRHDLERLPGMTLQGVDRIIRNRPYRKLDELVTKKSVTRKQFAQIREFITIGK